ncbi:hypothetical protein PCASD_24481 [Puccinia coronata f. sp. avenae]|uniref:Uncharacterized protein n=1 Tax=Puccinia coronata f. sp. avenae TaxID=200324 RepID=A0A2N5SDX9_9BASI|nr:hypothetical protein PCASD_24481 [Puccinia coronata f. sp. avenae]
MERIFCFKQQAAAAREQQLRQRSAPTGEQQYSSTGLEASSTAGEQQLSGTHPPKSSTTLESSSALTGQSAPPPSTEMCLVANYPETKPAPSYTLLFPHPRELPQEQGRNTPLALPRLSGFCRAREQPPPVDGI